VIPSAIACKFVGERAPICVRVVFLQSGEAEDEVDIVEREKIGCHRFDREVADFNVDGGVAVYSHYFLVGDSDLPRGNLCDGEAEFLDKFVIDIDGGGAGVDDTFPNVSIFEIAAVDWESALSTQ